MVFRKLICAAALLVTASAFAQETFTHQQSGLNFTLQAGWSYEAEGDHFEATSPDESVILFFFVGTGSRTGRTRSGRRRLAADRRSVISTSQQPERQEPEQQKDARHRWVSPSSSAVRCARMVRSAEASSASTFARAGPPSRLRASIARSRLNNSDAAAGKSGWNAWRSSRSISTAHN